MFLPSDAVMRINRLIVFLSITQIEVCCIYRQYPDFVVLTDHYLNILLLANSQSNLLEEIRWAIDGQLFSPKLQEHLLKEKSTLVNTL